MKKIIYVSPKENIELSCPDWLWPFMKRVWRHLRLKTVKFSNKSQIKNVVLDEFANL